MVKDKIIEQKDGKDEITDQVIDEKKNQSVEIDGQTESKDDHKGETKSESNSGEIQSDIKKTESKDDHKEETKSESNSGEIQSIIKKTESKDDHEGETKSESNSGEIQSIIKKTESKDDHEGTIETDIDDVKTESNENKEDKNEKEKDDNQSTISAPSTMSREAFNEVWKEYLRLRGSLVSELIMGLSATGIYCRGCNKQHHTYQTFTILSLNLPVSEDNNFLSSHWRRPKCTVLNMLKNFNEVANIADLNCEFCHKTTKGYHFQFLAHWPKVLIIQINRFAGGFGFGVSKDSTSVEIPIIIKSKDIISCFEESPFLLESADHLIPP
ncbi:MAG: hypothetical protein EZS28_044311, partial [Streblomastix strix]